MESAISTPTRPTGTYGVDAAWVPILWLALGIGSVVAAIAVAGAPAPWNVVLAFYFALLAAFMLLGAALYLHATLRGKFEVWAEVLNDMALRGDERALDLGCGRGAVTVMLAQRLPQGAVTGIDLWHSRDQSGNSMLNTRANIDRNDIADRVTLITGDMTGLPFADASFDLVTASLAIHNVHRQGGRADALQEALRVLAPGGRLVIVDISATKEYVRILGELGASEVKRRPLGWRMWWSGPWLPSALVAAVR